MKNCLIFVLCFITFSPLIASFEKDMKYHMEFYYYWSSTGDNTAWSCYFKLGDFGIIGYDYKIKIIGFIGCFEDGPADIYVTSKEKEENGLYVPVCNPDNHWQGKDYGPKSWHINNTYPNYDDCNVYDDNWHYSKDVDKFWCIYYINSCPPPFPIFDKVDITRTINSLTWYSKNWHKGIPGGYEYSNWCMHCVIVYWGVGVENTSIGVVKALFK